MSVDMNAIRLRMTAGGVGNIVTSVWVGNITSVVEDEIVKNLLSVRILLVSFPVSHISRLVVLCKAGRARRVQRVYSRPLGLLISCTRKEQ